MGLLADVYSYGDTLKRKVGGLLDDPAGTLEQMVGQFKDDQRNTLNLQDNAYPRVGDRTVLNTPEQVSGFRQQLADKAAEMAMAAATVWHGSPHKFDKFDSSKIGTGEGAQAYGHGLYLAENPSVAQSYKDALTQRTGMWDASVDGKSLFDAAADYGTTGYSSAFAQKYFDLIKNGKTENQAKQQISSQLQKRISLSKSPGDVKGAQEALDFISNAQIKMPEGSLYKVDLPDEHIAKMLDYDNAVPENVRKPLSQAALNEFGSGLTDASGEKLYKEMIFNFKQAGHPNPAQAATDWLTKQGVPGMRYLDGGSRGAGTGSSNFVVFPGNEGLLSILERNGQPLK